MKSGYDIEQFKSLEEGWFFYDHAWSLLFELIKKIEGETVLDVGCGTGFALGVMQSVFPWKRFLGVEPTEFGRNFWDARNIKVENASATNLPYKDTTFDTVFSSHVVEHIEEDEKAISEIIRVAKKRAIIVVPEGDVDAKQFGSSHVQIYNRKNFKEKILKYTDPGHKAVIYSLPHLHIPNLIAIIDKVWL